MEEYVGEERPSLLKPMMQISPLFQNSPISEHVSECMKIFKKFSAMTC